MEVHGLPLLGESFAALLGGAFLSSGILPARSLILSVHARGRLTGGSKIQTFDSFQSSHCTRLQLQGDQLSKVCETCDENIDGIFEGLQLALRYLTNVQGGQLGKQSARKWPSICLHLAFIVSADEQLHGIGSRSRGQQLESRKREEEEQRAADRAFADAWSVRLKELKQEEVGLIFLHCHLLDKHCLLMLHIGWQCLELMPLQTSSAVLFTRPSHHCT